MTIRRTVPQDRDILFDIWLRSVRATHDFVSEEHIQSFIPKVREHLLSTEHEFWVLCDDEGTIMGFMGISGSNIDTLFLAPEHFRRGGGRALLEHAMSICGSQLTLDVNEQNVGARRFYEACGFVVERRSELDGNGLPYPLLHMRLTGGDRPERAAGF
ncbi:MAG: GNAT family N-acetyltransferase [Phycisphaerae bacterium]|nr:GNAT family N-acetyltransferase [Phycisphaerae bacterium]